MDSVHTSILPRMNSNILPMYQCIILEWGKYHNLGMVVPFHFLTGTNCNLVGWIKKLKGSVQNYKPKWVSVERATQRKSDIMQERQIENSFKRATRILPI